MRFRTPHTPSLLAMLLCAAPLAAQGVSTQLSGRITQKGGKPLAEAMVLIQNQETGMARSTRTDRNGRYLATTLPVGAYVVTVSKPGFQTASGLKLTLNLGDAAPLNVSLAPEGGSTVEVVATVAGVDSERSSTAAILSPDSLANLPVFNRGFSSLASLTPQVVVDSNRGNLAIAGQRGVNTSINIDGGDNNEPFFGGMAGAVEKAASTFNISMEAIREYQVITDGASAEFGRMGGGYVNAITKNGSNEATGSVFYYTRPQSLVARGPNLNGKADSNKVGDFQQKQFGFSAGGPLVKDQLFYFVTFDAQRQTTPINQVWGGNNTVPTVLDPSKAADAVLLGKAGNYNSKSDVDTLFARFDWNLSLDQNLQLRINHSKYTGDVGAGLTASRDNLASDKVITDSYLLQWNWVLGPNWLNEVRVNYVKDDMPRVPAATSPQVSITNVGSYGAYPYDRTYSSKRTQFQENLSYVTPEFQIKGGLDYNTVDVSEFFAGNWRGVYYFDTLAAFEAGNWTTYRQNFGLRSAVAEAGLFSATTKQVAAYLQSEWRALDSLKLALGLRWDRQENPDYPILDLGNPQAAALPLTARIPTDSQFSPRFSFTYTPAADGGRTVVRGSLGRYVSTTPSVFLYQVFAANGQRTGSKDFKAADAVTYQIPRGSAFNPANPAWLPSYPSGATAAAVSVWSFSPDFQNPSTDRANVAVERSFQALVLGLSATYAKGRHLERTRDLNVGTPTLNPYGRTVYSARPNSGYATMGQYVSDATSLYHAYTASLKYHKDDSPLDVQVFYTYSINKDTDSNERNYSGIPTQDGAQLGKEWAYADSDRRHVLTGFLSFQERRWSGINASLAIRYLSGAPYSLVYGKDVNGDSNSSNDRYFLNGADSGRNSQRGASSTNLDLGLRREFAIVRKVKFTVSADVFNLLNRQDTYVRSAVAGASTDAVPALSTANAWVGAARQVQLGARLSF